MTETQLEWPADLGYATIVGRFGFMDADGPDEDRNPDITPATSGTVLITPSVDTVKYDGELGPMLLIKRRVEGVIDADGYLATKKADGTPGPRGIVVPATDADVQPTDFTYSVRISLAGSGTVASYSIKAPTDAVVDLAKATPVASSGGTVTVVDYTSAERAESAAVVASDAATTATTAANTATEARDTATAAATTATNAVANLPNVVVDTTAGTKVTIAGHVVHYDTGWRNISSLVTGVTTEGVLASRLRMARINNTVYIRLRCKPTQAHVGKTGWIALFDFNLPNGFRENPTSYGTLDSALTNGQTVSLVNDLAGNWLGLTATGAWKDEEIAATFSYVTADPLPTVLPGTA